MFGPVTKIWSGEKTVRADHFWSTKIGPGGPNWLPKWDSLYSLDLKNGSGSRDLLIK